jgi:hypothetical protein
LSQNRRFERELNSPSYLFPEGHARASSLIRYRPVKTWDPRRRKAESPSDERWAVSPFEAGDRELLERARRLQAMVADLRGVLASAA